MNKYSAARTTRLLRLACTILCDRLLQPLVSSGSFSLLQMYQKYLSLSFIYCGGGVVVQLVIPCLHHAWRASMARRSGVVLLRELALVGDANGLFAPRLCVC